MPVFDSPRFQWRAIAAHQVQWLHWDSGADLVSTWALSRTVHTEGWSPR